MVRKIGYACINTELGKQKIKMLSPKMATADKGGVQYLSEVILQNLDSLQQILEWNKSHDITFFRIGSELFPWMSKYNIYELPRINAIKDKCLQIGAFCNANDMRLSFHPGPFNVLCSPDERVVNNTIDELNSHSEIFNLMGFEPSHYNKINIHVGGVYGDKDAALKRWAENYYRLEWHARKRLTIENDDKANMYSVVDLFELHKLCNGELPIVFDYFHHKFNDGGLTEREALQLAISTWDKKIVPVAHYSESRREEQQRDMLRLKNISLTELEDSPTLKIAYNSLNDIKAQAHSDMIQGPIDSYGNVIDIMFEAKMKEQALLEFRNLQLQSII
jgi:UV DNA damage endonuclease